MTADFTDRLQAALGSAYAIERELGGGGMSRVYLARETALGREVVLKVLPPELTSSVNLDRFRREIQYAAQLQHPHIVPLLNAGESDDLLWYTMPLIAGESLRTVLERRGALPPREVLQILHDVADALGTAHRLGLVHRDIKPENILLQGEHALVTDFGVAKAISAALPGASATAVGVAVGTPAYMAPEQVAGDPAADHRIDIYAVGLLAYELLTGAAPFQGTSPHQTMAAHLIRQPTPPDAMLAGLPPGLSSLVMRCLRKDPDERYPDAAALIADLRRISDGEGGRIARVRHIGPHSRRTSRPGMLVLGTVVIAAALTIGYALAGARRPPPAAAPAADSAATLTLTDSLAIAAAVERELALRSEAAASITRSMLDSIRREITTTVTDSVRRASRAAASSRGGGSLPAPSGDLLEIAGRSGGGSGPSRPGSFPRMGAESSSRIMVVPSATSRGEGWLAQSQRELTERVNSALTEAGALQVVQLAGRSDTLLARGVSPEAVARFSNSRFYVTMSPVRSRDSAGVTVVIHDLDPASRQVRTLVVPVAPQNGGAQGLASSIADRVAAAVAEMRGAPRLHPLDRARPTPQVPPIPPVLPDSIRP